MPAVLWIKTANPAWLAPLQDPESAGAGPIQHQMIHLAAAVVVKGKRLIGGIRKIIAFQPAETFVHSAKWSQVRFWHETDQPGRSIDVRLWGVIGSGWTKAKPT
jgi:hypothetical protein